MAREGVGGMEREREKKGEREVRGKEGGRERRRGDLILETVLAICVIVVRSFSFGAVKGMCSLWYFGKLAGKCRVFRESRERRARGEFLYISFSYIIIFVI